LEQLVQERVAAGVQEYAAAPVAVSCVEAPAHTGLLAAVITTAGWLTTLTVTAAVAEQPLLVPVTV
jgi:hypothetical protein